jgi:O-antigen/teichoic acid export membrane protein
MKKKFLQDISASLVQVIINQIAAIIIFLIISKFIDKTNFGELNWSLAILITSFAILGAGIDQVVVKKIANGTDSATILSSYLLHNLLFGLFFLGLLIILSIGFNNFFASHYLLLFVAISQLLLFFSLPFKQVAIGNEKFKLLMFMSTCSNVLRAAILLFLSLNKNINIRMVVIIFIITSVVELFLCIYLVRFKLKIPIRLNWNKKNYFNLLRESLPQMGVVIFNSAVARFDWILIGFMTTAVILAEYSFAYKVYEITTLPLMIVAPLLLPRFTRYFSKTQEEIREHHELLVFLRIEVITGCIVALFLNLLWIPVTDTISDGKYSYVNQYTILILSGCMPFLYLNNFLWTVNFAKSKLKMIFYIITATFLINIIGDIILIPIFKAEGAAIAFLLAMVAQTFMYSKKTTLKGMSRILFSLIFCTGVTFAIVLISKNIFLDPWIEVLVATGTFFGIIFSTKQVKFSDWLIIKRVIGL